MKSLNLGGIRPPKMPAGYKLKPLPSRPKHGSHTGSSNNSSKLPGVSPSSSKNPVKQAQQIKDPGAKKDAMSQAKSLVKFLPNGQWAMEKQEKDSTVR